MCAPLNLHVYTGKRLSDLPKVKQLVNDKAETKRKLPGCPSGASTTVPC